MYDFIGEPGCKQAATSTARAVFDQSGWSVALSVDGSRVVIGTYFNDGNGINAGHVRVYDFIGEPGCKRAATSTARR
ncbi:MAG: hypothetical protein H6559_03420 [Lewinellaceae bacterium]|nr:hypothetical protein [Lewinellaceae bacterium]